jgi:hypothetical protein
MKALLFRLLWLPLMACGAWAQTPVQNMDISFLFGPLSVKAQTVPGTTITLQHYTGVSALIVYGYQLEHTKAGSLWLEMFPASSSTLQPRTPALPGSVDISPAFITPGLRFMVPVHPRFSFYGVAGGGAGFFSYVVQTPAASPTVLVNSTVHGVADVGGGADFRFNVRFSLRGEVRDYITGRGLSGVEGRNHVVIGGGLVFHF